MEDGFLFLENDWLYREFERLEFVRSQKYHTFKAALNLVSQRSSGPVIVETGTQRMHDDPGGASTLLFAAFCRRYGGHLTTVDIDPRNMEISKAETAAYADRVTYVVQDSVEFLRSYSGSVDLLYLDSMDCQPVGDSSPAQAHQVREYVAAEHALHDGTVLLCDDSNFPSGGKTRKLKKFLLEEGEWECILDLGQMLWQRKR